MVALIRSQKNAESRDDNSSKSNSRQKEFVGTWEDITVMDELDNLTGAIEREQYRIMHTLAEDDITADHVRQWKKENREQMELMVPSSKYSEYGIMKRIVLAMTGKYKKKVKRSRRSKISNNVNKGRNKDQESRDSSIVTQDYKINSERVSHPQEVQSPQVPNRPSRPGEG